MKFWIYAQTGGPRRAPPLGGEEGAVRPTLREAGPPGMQPRSAIEKQQAGVVQRRTPGLTPLQL